MVKSIKIFRYEYAPSIATILDKIGTKKTLKRPVSQLYLDNVNELTELTTTIRNLERFEDGVFGKADYQYITSVKRSDGTVYEDFNIRYEFYINEKLKILIIGGSSDHRNQFKTILEQFFNEGVGYATPITILRDPLYELVQKIQSDGPRLKNIAGEMKPKNIIKEFYCHIPDIVAHEGVKKEGVGMFHTESYSKCASESQSFKRAFPDCETFDVKMKIYQCNGIWDVQTTTEYATLDMKASAEFTFSRNPAFQFWIIFVLQTVTQFIH